MKKTIAISLVPLFAATMFAQGPPRGGGGFGGGFGMGRGMLGAGPRSAPVTGAPYSGTETVTSQQTLAGGNQISRSHTSTVARDSQGRISTSETVTPPAASGKAPFTIQTIFDPVAGFRYELDSATMIARQEPLPKPRTTTGTPPARPARPNETTVTLPTQVINGVPATGTQITETIPAGAIGNAAPIQSVRTTWVATTLQVPVEIKTSDPRFGTTDMELTNIMTVEPSASLFMVPSGYTIKQGGGRGPGGRGQSARGGGPGSGPGAGAARFRGGAPGGGPPQE
ncbi:MAG TPA: hypothetical protein VG273_09115 [Bryobacteraceae bacterium]|jgi:hypothetical protein|nr:hypothetical protein [Bryobacteraceae bacterium]